MERSEILATMVDLKLYDMKAAFDEIITTAVKRHHEPQRIVGDLLQAEIAEKQARSIKYQITIAKLPLAKDIEDFRFTGTPINETLVRDLAGREFLAHERNAVLVGGTGTGKTHLATAIARACIRNGAGAASSTSSISSTGSKPSTCAPARRPRQTSTTSVASFHPGPDPCWQTRFLRNRAPSDKARVL